MLYEVITLVARRMDKLAAGYGSLFDEAELRELESLLHNSTPRRARFWKRSTAKLDSSNKEGYKP